MGYQQNRSSSISTFHDYNQQSNEYEDDSGWKGFGNDDKSNSREYMAQILTCCSYRLENDVERAGFST